MLHNLVLDTRVWPFYKQVQGSFSSWLSVSVHITSQLSEDYSIQFSQALQELAMLVRQNFIAAQDISWSEE